ncbi:MAG: hypothetical protein V4721_01440 [Bacteroidota bacterium]
MKTPTIKHISLLLAVFSCASCSGKLLDLEKLRNKQRDTGSTSITSNQTGSLRSGRLTFTTDSAFNVYTVTIFPTETFSWSPEQGFKGRALKIEASSRTQTVTKIADSSASDFQTTIRNDYENKERTVYASTSKVIKKRRVSSIAAMLVLAFILLGAWLYWRRK